jgi:bifunctional DNA-binding transcriptional regulator/antitoxin component of YhaV-PrlF toxin-antitoxin module
MYYMKYSSTITSKGTITIAAPLRKALGFSPGQKVSLTLNNNRQVVIGGGITVADFEKIRDGITNKIPSHKKGLTGQALKEATAKAWIANYNE